MNQICKIVEFQGKRYLLTNLTDDLYSLELYENEEQLENWEVSWAVIVDDEIWRKLKVIGTISDLKFTGEETMVVKKERNLLDVLYLASDLIDTISKTQKRHIERN